MNEIARGQSLRHSAAQERSVAPAKAPASRNQWNPRGSFERADLFFARELGCGQRP